MASDIVTQTIPLETGILLIGSENKSKVLCQSVHKKFNKTPTGKIYEEDLKDIYALMILALDLTEINYSNKLFGSKTESYTFTIEEGLRVLADLNLNIDNKINSINISYKINNTVGLTSLTKFFDSNLLHCPDDRTRSKLKRGIVLQPTPKGVSVVNNFIAKNGIGFERVPDILIGLLNSLEIMTFERNYLNDRISYSFNLIQVLFSKMFGQTPNVWSSTSPNPKFKSKLDLSLFKTTSYTGALPLPLEFHLRINKYHNSPLYHKYFTNPESDSHIQYFVDGTSVRIFKNRVLYIGKEMVKFDYCVSGKAITQWLMDCTDILSRKIAIEIGQIFVNVGYLIPIIHNNCKDISLKNSSELLFYFSESGKKKLQWFNSTRKAKLLPMKVNTELPTKGKDLTLHEVLRDPGLRYIFKLHLKREFCSENINAYDLLQLFLKKLNLLTKLLNYININYNQDSKMYKNQVLKISKDCLALIYHIYFTYLAPQASFELNIDYVLRSKITSLLVDNDRSFNILNSFHDCPNSDNIGSFSDSCSHLPNQYQEDSKDSEKSFNHSSQASDDLIGEATTKDSSISDGLSNQVVYAQVITNDDDEDDGEDDNSVFSSKVHLSPTNSKTLSSNFLTKTPTSPRDKEFKEIYHSLLCFTPIATEIMNSLFKMMEIDSFPKFLVSTTLDDHKYIFD